MKHGNFAKKVGIFTLIATQVAIPLFSDISYGWSYPLKEVTKLECKKTPWDQLEDTCKQSLPRITNAEYSKYANNVQYTYIYSTLWGATYTNGRDYWKGAHEGVDIATAQGTPVYAMGNGVVTKAGRQNGYGNVVVIKHTLADKTVLYSTYAHLNSISTQAGWKINEGDLLGTVGNEGFSFGNHLLWDINRTIDNTYAYRGCTDYQNTSSFSTYSNIVNGGLCRDYLFKRTLDPIAFVETNGNIVATEALMRRGTTTTGSTTPITNTTRPQRVMVPILPTVPTNTTSTNTTKTTTVNTTKPVSTTTNTSTKSTTSVVTQTTPKTTTVNKTTMNDTMLPSAPTQIVATTFVSSTGVKNKDAFLQKYTITVTPNFRSTITKGSATSLSIKIQDANGKPYAGMIGQELSITPSLQNIDISPRIIRYISQGESILLLYAKEKGKTDLVVMYGNIVLGKLTVTIQ